MDLSELDSLKDFGAALDRAGAEAERHLAEAAYARAVQLASERLRSRREIFLAGLHLRDEGGVVVLELDAKVRWVEDGLPARSLLDDLLKSPKAKRAKDGSTYIVIPFKHGPGKGPTNSPASQAPMVDAMRDHLRKAKVPWATIEKDDQGRPQLGRLHTLKNVMTPPKTGYGPGQGWGPVGAQRQGPNERQKVGGGPGGGGTPFLQGASVYQRQGAGGKVERSVVTFRVASSKHRGQGRWRAPDLPGVHVLDDVAAWAEGQVDAVALEALGRVVDGL